MTVQKFASCLLSLFMLGNARAESVAFEMLGFISGKPAAYQNVGSVRVGDAFRLVVSYEDIPYQTRSTTVNGSDVYSLLDHVVSFDLADWSGSLASEIRAKNAALTGSMTGGSVMEEWHRPLTTIHHRDWSISSGIFTGNDNFRGFTLSLVTNYVTNYSSNPGGENYGWWEIGTGGTIDQGFLTLTAINRVPPVPEPNTYAMLLAGLVLTSFVLRARRKVPPSTL